MFKANKDCIFDGKSIKKDSIWDLCGSGNTIESEEYNFSLKVDNEVLKEFFVCDYDCFHCYKAIEEIVGGYDAYPTGCELKKK